MDAITLTYDVPVSQAAAFYLFVGEIGRWWPGVHTHDPARFEGMTIEARPGGALTMHFDGRPDVPWGEVVEVDAPRRIVFTTFWRSGRHRPTLISVTFAESEWGTRVVFQHDGWTPENIGLRARFVEWPIILSHYVSHARKHARRGGLAPRPSRGVA